MSWSCSVLSNFRAPSLHWVTNCGQVAWEQNNLPHRHWDKGNFSHLLYGPQALLHQVILWVGGRCPVEYGQDQQGEPCDPLHGEEEEGLHGEVLAPLVGLQPLEVFPEHDIVLTVMCACVCVCVCVCMCVWVIGYVHITTPLHHTHVPLHEALELSRLVDLVCAVRYVAVKLVFSLL